MSAELKAHIPWLRVFVEGVVIVGSILTWMDLVEPGRDPFFFFFPRFGDAHEDPRWAEWLDRVGRSEEELAAIPFEMTLPR